MSFPFCRFEAEISGQAMLNGSFAGGFALPGFGNIPPPPAPPMMIPNQLKNYRKSNNNYDTYGTAVVAQPAVVSAKPTLYTIPTKSNVVPPQPTQSSVDFIALQSEVEKKLKKLKNEKISAEVAISQGRWYLWNFAYSLYLLDFLLF